MKTILKQLILDESNREGKAWVRRKLNPTEENYFRALMGSMFGALGNHLIKNDLEMIEKTPDWDYYKKLELCRKDDENRIDETDFMTHGTRTVEAVYEYLKQFKSIRQISHKGVRNYVKERLKYKRRMPNWSIVLTDKQGKEWMIDGNHRAFHIIMRKLKGKTYDLPMLYIFRRKK